MHVANAKQIEDNGTKNGGLFGDWTEQNAVQPQTIEQAQPAAFSIGVWKIAFGVLVGNVLTGIVGGIIYELVK